MSMMKVFSCSINNRPAQSARDGYHCFLPPQLVFFTQSNKARAVAILTPHIRRAPSFFALQRDCHNVVYPPRKV